MMHNSFCGRAIVDCMVRSSFFVKEYKSYTGRNPKTGEKVTIKPKKLPFFKSGKELKERVNRINTPET